MWMPLPFRLAIPSAALLSWYALAFVFLFRLRVAQVHGPGPPRPWRVAVAVPLLGAGAWFVVDFLDQGAVFQAYGLALLTAGVCLPVVGWREAALPQLSGGNMLVWLLGFAALVLRLAAPDVAPPGLAEDEAKKCLDCVAVLAATPSGLQGSSPWIATAFRIGSLAHPNFPCLIIGPLLALFGPSVFVAHVYSMVAGALSVVAFYVLASMLLMPPAALAATALLVTSPHHLLYSRVMFGTEIILPQILFLAFAIDAARRLSRVSAIMAGAALGILLYHYVVVRVLIAALLMIFVAAQVADWHQLRRRAATLFFLLLTTLITVAPLLAQADGRTFLLNPMQYGLFTLGGGASAADTWQWLVKVVRGHLLLFHVGGVSGVIAHSRVTVLPLLLEFLLVFGFAAAAVRINRFGSAVMAALFAIGLLPSVLSGVPNSHRTMLVIPAVYLLIGNGLEQLAAFVPQRRYTPSVLAGALATVVLVGAGQSLHFYFGAAWGNANDWGNFGDRYAQLAKEAQRLTATRTTFVTRKPYEIRFLNYDAIRTGRLRQFSYGDWLPENWRPEPRALLFDLYWDRLRWELRQAFPVGELRTLVNPFGRTVAMSVALSPDDLRQLKQLTPKEEHCGALMFGVPRRVVAVRSGALEIDGIAVNGLAANEQPWFAAGLHRACLSAVAEVEIAAATGTTELTRLSPADLYRIPVQGWLHRINCVKTPRVTSYLGVEPFLYRFALPRTVIPPCDPREIEDTFSAVLAPLRHATTFQLWSRAAQVEVMLDGQSLGPKQLRAERALLTVPARTASQRLDIRVRGVPDIILYTQEGSTYTQGRTVLRVPPYGLFSPPAEETAIAPSAVAWGRFPGAEVGK